MVCAMLLAVAVAWAALFANDFTLGLYYLPNDVMAVAFTPPIVAIAVVLILAGLKVAALIWNGLVTLCATLGAGSSKFRHRFFTSNSAPIRADVGGRPVHSVVGLMVAWAMMLMVSLLASARAFGQSAFGDVWGSKLRRSAQLA